MSITMADGTKWTEEETDAATLAFLIWKRWGCDMAGAAVAWRRLHQNSCPDYDFEKLVKRAVARR